MERYLQTVFEKFNLLSKDYNSILYYDDSTLSLAKIFKVSLSRYYNKFRVEHINSLDNIELGGNKNLIFGIAHSSLTYNTKVIRYYSENKCKLISMPGITYDMIARKILILNSQEVELTDFVSKEVDEASELRVCTDNGTDLKFSVKGRYSLKSSFNTEKKRFFNLPMGEVAIAPIEDSVNGIIAVDGSMLDRKLENNDKCLLHIYEGKVKRIEGVLKEELEELLSKYANKPIVGEFGIGTNSKAIVSGNALEDEKASGTVHFGIGRNIPFGGVIEAPFHYDFVINNPIVSVDGKHLDILTRN